MSGESFVDVEQSPDGSAWSLLGRYGTCAGCTPITDCADIAHSLASTTRFVRWRYTKAGGNCGLDEVSITALGSCNPKVGFEFADSDLVEGNAGTTNHSVAVIMDIAPTSDVTVEISDTGTGSATAGVDYTFSTTALVFTSAESYPATKNAIVTIIGDQVVEPNETVVLSLAVTGGTADVEINQHTVTILNDDQNWYRSSGAGNWTAAASWEVSGDGGATWNPASTSPVAGNSAVVWVQHEIFLDQDIQIDDVTIEAGATLTIPSTSQFLLVNSGPTPQLVIEGTLIDGGSTSNGLGFSTGTRWLMGDAGTVIKTNNNGTSNYRSSYLNSPNAPDLPAGSTFIYRYTGSPMSVSSSDWRFGTLIFESTNGFFAFDGATTRLNEFGNFEVKTLLDIGGSGSGTVRVLNQKAVTTLTGDLIIGAGSEMRNQSYNGSTPHGIRLDFLNSQATVDGILEWTIGSGECRFLSNTDVFGVDEYFRARTLTISAEPTFHAHARVTHELAFTGGNRVNTSGTAEIRVQRDATAAVTGYDPSAYVNGRLRRDVSSGNSYDFPVGDNTHYALFTLAFNTTNAPNILGYFNPVGVPAGLQNCIAANQSYDYQTYCGGWSVTPGGGSNHDYTITLTPVLGNDLFFTIEKDGVIEPCPTGLSASYNAFSQFDLHAASQALPVEWLYFRAAPYRSWVRLDWATASELNNAYYGIEYSLDGARFSEIGRSYGSGTTMMEKTYFADHFTPVPGLNYYRLRQVDWDGRYAYSPVRVVDFRRQGSGLWSLWGDGNGGLLYLVAEEPAESAPLLQVYLSDGRLWSERRLLPGEVRYALDTGGWPAGPYYLRITEPRGSFTLPWRQF